MTLSQKATKRGVPPKKQLNQKRRQHGIQRMGINNFVDLERL